MHVLVLQFWVACKHLITPQTNLNVCTISLTWPLPPTSFFFIRIFLLKSLWRMRTDDDNIQQIIVVYKTMKRGGGSAWKKCVSLAHMDLESVCPVLLFQNAHNENQQPYILTMIFNHSAVTMAHWYAIPHTGVVIHE